MLYSYSRRVIEETFYDGGGESKSQERVVILVFLFRSESSVFVPKTCERIFACIWIERCSTAVLPFDWPAMVAFVPWLSILTWFILLRETLSSAREKASENSALSWLDPWRSFRYYLSRVDSCMHTQYTFAHTTKRDFKVQSVTRSPNFQTYLRNLVVYFFFIFCPSIPDL